VKLICGLGNPGPDYRLTRHNIGYRVVDLLADRWKVSEGRTREGASVLEVTRGDETVVLVKPLRFMNRSGGPVGAAVRRAGADPETDLLVIADDIDLPLGRIRLRPSGSAGGHNGLRDIIAALDTEHFSRLRVGIGRGSDTVDHVLSTFDADERDLAAEAIATAADAAERWLAEGMEAAMNGFNGLDLAEPPEA
jgi:PTH1 family peptidyl-tRNA hydrolase